MKKKLQALILPVIFGLLLTAFTVYLILDTFVLTRVYDTIQPTQTAAASTAASSVTADTVAPVFPESASAADETPSAAETAAETAETPAPETETTVSEPVITDSSYIDNNIQITLTQYRYNNSDIYVADVVLTDPAYLKTGLANGQYGRNVTAKTSVIAGQYAAILAVNGDFYGAQEDGYVLRNGVLCRNTAKDDQEGLVIYADGSFEIINENDVTAESLVERGAVQILSFGPGIVENGRISVTEKDEVGHAQASNPRTAIAQIGDLHYLFIVSDGRTDQSYGLSLHELAEFVQSLGAETAYNLDGGGSSAMVFNGVLINHPATTWNAIEERSVSDIVYIGY